MASAYQVPTLVPFWSQGILPKSENRVIVGKIIFLPNNKYYKEYW